MNQLRNYIRKIVCTRTGTLQKKRKSSDNKFNTSVMFASLCKATTAFTKQGLSCTVLITSTQYVPQDIDHLCKSDYSVCQRLSSYLLFVVAHHHSWQTEYPLVSTAALWVTGYLGACVGYSFLFTQLHLV